MNKLGKKLVLASGNAGKLREFQQIFAHSGMDVLPQAEFAITDAEETGLTFVENAIIKARHAAKLSGLPALADDSGLAVDFLDGAPGIYSSRFSGANATDQSNNDLLLARLKDVPEAQRTASFHCVLVLMQHAEDPVPLIFHGQWQGIILPKAQGEQGFGYDPLFYVPEHQCSSAELSAELKNQISHRGKAVAALIQAING